MLKLANKLIIAGASGHGKVVADIAIKMNKWQNITFLDDDENIKSSMGLEVIGKISDAFLFRDEADFFVAVGNNSTRELIQEDFTNKGLNIVTLVHPNAIIGSEVEIGSGTVVMAGVVINSSAKIGKGCILNTGCNIDHDNEIDNYVHISPGVNLAGSVKVGEKTWIGMGSNIINNVSITSNCTIGAGSLIVKDICTPGKYYGSPAKKKD